MFKGLTVKGHEYLRAQVSLGWIEQGQIVQGQIVQCQIVWVRIVQGRIVPVLPPPRKKIQKLLWQMQTL
jgi:hypothetical protein